MEVETSANIDVDAFLPPTGRKRARAGQKRTISTSAGAEEQMQVDESGIEGARKTQAPKTKRKKNAAIESRKIPVPAHRCVE